MQRYFLTLAMGRWRNIAGIWCWIQRSPMWSIPIRESDTSASILLLSDQVMVIRIAASEKGAVQFTLRPTIPYIKPYGKVEGDGGGKSGTVTGEGKTLTLSGVMHYYNIAFEGQMRVITENGSVEITADASGDHAELHVAGADSALILIAVGTNYRMESRVLRSRTPKRSWPPIPIPTSGSAIYWTKPQPSPMSS